MSEHTPKPGGLARILCIDWFGWLISSWRRSRCRCFAYVSNDLPESAATRFKLYPARRVADGGHGLGKAVRLYCSRGEEKCKVCPYVKTMGESKIIAVGRARENHLTIGELDSDLVNCDGSGAAIQDFEAQSVIPMVVLNINKVVWADRDTNTGQPKTTEGIENAKHSAGRGYPKGGVFSKWHEDSLPNV